MNELDKKTTEISPSDVAKYYLSKSAEDGDLITPLKMQKLVYYAYVWTLVKNGSKLFSEEIQAWPNGPVIPSLYRELKSYGSSPIPTDYIGIDSKSEFDLFTSKFPEKVRSTLDEVYEKYISKSAFELVVMTHSEKPWKEARKGLGPTDKSQNIISDTEILNEYGEKI